MQNRRRHYFPANDCTVITAMRADGEYTAVREDDALCLIRGHGHSRYSAIADLVEMIAKTDFEEVISEAANV